jgi:hypothetical protein
MWKNDRRSICFGFVIGIIGSALILLTIAACGDRESPIPPAAVEATSQIEHLAGWGSLKEGVSVIRDEKNGNLVYVGAVGWAGKSYSISVTVVPHAFVRKAEEKK